MRLLATAWTAVLLGATAAGAAAADATHVSNERTRTWWSRVEQALSVREAPDRDARALGRLAPYTWYGRRSPVLVLQRRGRWTQVRYSGIGRRVGWVPNRALSPPRLNRSLVVVNTRRRLLRAFVRGREVMRARVGVGARRSPTPRGRFFVKERLVPSNRRGIYGVLAFGLSAHSRHRTDWPGGGQVGIHGTNQPGLIPGRISNGCVRLRNRDIRRLDRVISAGTPVRVR